MPGERCALAPPAAVTLRRQSSPSAKQESSPPHVSLLNPLLWLLPGQQRKATKVPRQLWQAAPLSAGQKLIPSSSPVPPTQGAGLARLAFCESLSGGVKSREQASRGWSLHQCSHTGRREGQTSCSSAARAGPPAAIPLKPQHQALSDARGRNDG